MSVMYRALRVEVRSRAERGRGAARRERLRTALTPERLEQAERAGRDADVADLLRPLVARPAAPHGTAALD